jgi:hypothetical protein
MSGSHTSRHPPGAAAAPPATAGPGWQICWVLLAELVAVAALLFVTRYLARGHLAIIMDQECHIGGIATELLGHGVRFPLVAYAPNEYDNGSFYSGVLTALSFALLGRRLLALKLVTHLVSAAGAVATLWLLRSCLDELGLTRRSVRWTATAALVIAIAAAPRVVTMFSMYAVGNHAEGSALDAILLAWFTRRPGERSAWRTALFWAAVGFALYLNKGAFLVIPVLAVAQVIVARRALARLGAALAGFAIGLLPELLVVAQQVAGGWGALGWQTILSKEHRNSQAFPKAIINSLLFLGEYRIELLTTWALALVSATVAWVRSVLGARRTAAPAGGVSVALGVVIGISWFHLAALSVMAKSGLDAYVIYGYPTLAVLFALLIAHACNDVVRRAWLRPLAAGAVAVAATLVLYRPFALTWGTDVVRALWHDREGAVCSWRFAEGFEREQEFGLAPGGLTREEHAIRRCRSLSEPDQVLDCIGGIARELVWRQADGRVHGEPPAELDARERRAYAYQYGTHRKGKMAPCDDFTDAELVATCRAAVALECLHYADLYTRIFTAHFIGPPRCEIPEPPMRGFWSARRRDLLRRRTGVRPNLMRAWGDDNLDACRAVFDRCYL